MNPDQIATKQDIIALQNEINHLLETLRKITKDIQSPEEEYLTSKQVIEIFKISKSHLTDLRNEGKIPFSKQFGIILYPRTEIDRMIREEISSRCPKYISKSFRKAS